MALKLFQVRSQKSLSNDTVKVKYANKTTLTSKNHRNGVTLTKINNHKLQTMGLAQSKRSLRTGKTHHILHESWSTNVNFHFSTDVVNKY